MMLTPHDRWKTMAEYNVLLNEALIAETNIPPRDPVEFAKHDWQVSYWVDVATAEGSAIAPYRLCSRCHQRDDAHVLSPCDEATERWETWMKRSTEVT